MDDLVGVVLAAGAGTRLRPVTRVRPKALCPVGNVPLVDLALARVRPLTAAVAVNLHHGREALDEHLPDDVHRSVEPDEVLGTAGALGQLRGWIDGRAALVVNADAWAPGSLAGFVEGWDRERTRLLLAAEDDDEPSLRPTSGIVGALMPWSEIAPLPAEPASLYTASWLPADREGRLDVVGHDGPFIDCGTPAQYLAANMAVSGDRNVIEPGAAVDGTLDRCVVWAGGRVHRSASLRSAIVAAERVIVLVR